MSWLEAIGEWNQPVIILAKCLPSGNTPGSVFAYFALCKELYIPVLGILQIGGIFDISKKADDNLPWCGWLPAHVDEVIQSKIANKSHMDIHETAFKIRARYFDICNKIF